MIHVQSDLLFQYLCRIGEILYKRYFNPLLHNEFIFGLTSLGKRSRKALEIVHGFTEKVINERKALRKTGTGERNFGEKRRLAFLDLLLDEAEKRPLLTDKDIREEVDTFIVAVSFVNFCKSNCI